MTEKGRQDVLAAFDAAETVLANPAAQADPQDISHYTGVVKNANGLIQWCTASALAILTQHPKWSGVLRRNLFTKRDMVFGGITEGAGGEAIKPREICDGDHTQALVWFNRNGFPNASKSVVIDVLEAVSKANSYDPMLDWMNGLVWDGTSRLQTWLHRYVGAEDCHYNNEIGFRWMISAVARALAPGCKADACLVLEGDQGSGKSSVFRILASDEFFGDALPDLKHKDAQGYVMDKWVIEIAELASLNSTSFEAIKAFISRQEERYRPPYGRHEVTEPRRCVFAGTTNRGDYLRDPTGNRRFWPVVSGKIDLEALKQDRDQLWAEAAHLYHQGEIWWLTGETVVLAQEEQATRGDDDPWAAEIDAYCDGKEAVACKTILAEVFQLRLDEQTKGNTKRVADILRKLNFKREGQFTKGAEKGLARFVRVSGS